MAFTLFPIRAISDESLYAGTSVGVEFAFSDPLYFNLEVGIELFELMGEDNSPSLALSWSGGLHFFF